MFKLLYSLTLTERILVGVLSLVILISTFQIGEVFYDTHSVPTPGNGGTYVEGVVGSFQFLNPVLAQTDLDRDVSGLVSCGLTRFDPISNSIVDDAASHTLSPDQRTYTFTLKENIYWQDGEPVTADDVIFTFREVIQHENFPNPTLAADFLNVQITKIDERTITMTLKKKYAFFIYNTGVGLLPKHLLKDIPVGDMLGAEYNLHPVGCGPYAIESVTGSQIRLTAFPGYFRGRPYLDSVVFRIFQSEDQLFKNIGGITGTKDISTSHINSLGNDGRLELHNFTLPQYVALFFNTDRDILKNRNTRLGLQLAIDKKRLLASINDSVQILDTPLLEIASSNWKYEFSAEHADGAFFDAGWRYPGSEPAKETVDIIKTESSPKIIIEPSKEKYYATERTKFFLKGITPPGASAIIINNYQLKNFIPSQTTWIYKASTTIRTLKSGENKFIVEAIINGKREEIDRLIVFQSANADARDAWLKKKIATERPIQPVKTVKNIKPINKSPWRQNSNGDKLSLNLLVSAERPEFIAIAKDIKKQWQERGIELIIEPMSASEFTERLNKRDYDIVLLGQNLGYNLDAYPFWHSSEARPGGSNLSNLRSSAVNAWLEQIRSSFNSTERRKRLSNLRETLATEIPAVILYTPIYTFAIDKKIRNFNLGQIALQRDRLANLPTWYVRESRKIESNVGIWSFLKWFFTEAL